MGLVSAEEFKRRRDIVEKGLGGNPAKENTFLRKRDPSQLEGDQPKKVKKLGTHQLSFGEELEKEGTHL